MYLFIYYHTHKGIQLICKFKYTHTYITYISLLLYHVSLIQFRYQTIHVLLDVDLEHLIIINILIVQYSPISNAVQWTIQY